ncbi:DISARM system phospholipase D-like protein DrmC (plasmid) [Synechococcus elongatus IITB7]|uniref:DISARM system phospholipase D-like protein DrmC n=1 Tax=Synechococcus elongatus TaxID=32046 RepID=UPI0030CEFF2A
MPNLSAFTWRQLARQVRQNPWELPSSAVLLGNQDDLVREQVTPLLESFRAAGATPEAIALCFEQLALAQERLQRERDAWSLVWSGPDPQRAYTEDTFAVVTRVVEQAQRSLLISTYNLGRSQRLLDFYEMLANRLARQELETVQLFFHPVELTQKDIPLTQATIQDWFIKTIWPWTARPKVYVDQRCLGAGRGTGVHHAKCVIADRSIALVTSANWSEAAQQLNLEAGWLTTASERAQLLQRQFEDLIAAEVYIRVV